MGRSPVVPYSQQGGVLTFLSGSRDRATYDSSLLLFSFHISCKTFFCQSFILSNVHSRFLFLGGNVRQRKATSGGGGGGGAVRSRGGGNAGSMWRFYTGKNCTTSLRQAACGLWRFYTDINRTTPLRHASCRDSTIYAGKNFP